MNIAQDIIEIIKDDLLKDDEIEINLSDDLLTTGILDSMALIRLVAAIESKYSIKIPPTDLIIENFLNIESMQSYLKNRLAQ